jgi:hypothetical protein
MRVVFENLNPKYTEPTRLHRRFTKIEYPSTITISDYAPQNLNDWIPIDSGEFDKYANNYNIYYRRKHNGDDTVKMYRYIDSLKQIHNDIKNVENATSIKLFKSKKHNSLKDIIHGMSKDKPIILNNVNDLFTIPKHTHNVSKISNTINNFETQLDESSPNICLNCENFILNECRASYPPWYTVKDHDWCRMGINKYNNMKFDQ